MSRVARWRRGSDNPPTACGWLYRKDLRTFKVDRRGLIRFCTITPLCAGAASVFGAAYPHLNGVTTIFAVGAALFLFDKTAPRRKPEPKEPPEVGDAFEVGLTIRDARGLRTGRDQGWLIFSQGWVLFEGARTDFAVTRGESSRQVREGTLTLRLEDGRKVAFAPVGESGRLNRAFNAWEIAPIPDGEAVLPPSEAYPEIWAERHALCLVGGLVSLAISGFAIGFGSLFVAIIGLLTAGTCLGASRAYARRVRLAVVGLSTLPSGNPSFGTMGEGREARDPEGLATGSV